MKLDKINLVYIKYKLFLDKVKSIIKESKSPEEAISLLNDEVDRIVDVIDSELDKNFTRKDY